MTYKGYRIERIDPHAVGNYGNKWGVFAEHHDYGRVTWRITYRARTIEECKQGIRAHFGRL